MAVYPNWKTVEHQSSSTPPCFFRMPLVQWKMDPSKSSFFSILCTTQKLCNPTKKAIFQPSFWYISKKKKKKLDLISTSKSCLCYQNGQPVSPNFTHSILAKRKASLATSLPSQEKKSKTYPTQNWSFNLETSSHHPLLTQTHAFKSRWNMDFFRHVPLWRRNGYFGFGKTTGL